MNSIQKKTEEELSITVTIAERAYKMTIVKSEEESLRKAGKRINEDLENMGKMYKNKEKQDLLAMIALLNTNELIKSENNLRYNDKMTTRLEEIDNLLIEESGI